MSDSQNRPTPEQGGVDDAERDLAEHERPDVGLIGDEDLPEDLQPTDDNPLAKSPGDEQESDDAAETGKVEGMPDMGASGGVGGPGAPA
jgi:hypothetical protein